MRRFQQLLLLLPPLGFFLWSFILTDRHLLYSSTAAFVAFQNLMWGFSANRLLVVMLYLTLITSLLFVYVRILRLLKAGKKLPGWGVVVGFLLLLALSNPALSYDLFNYMFDAKLVVQYRLDPHMTSAIDFAGKDDWVRFMRNVFFPTTYGYVWTAMSVVPFLIGAGKFLTVFVAFKLYVLLSLGLLFVLQRQLYRRLFPGGAKQMGYRLALFFASPLVLIESLSSGHNDAWMMVPAFASLLILLPGNLMVGKHLQVKLSSRFRVVLQMALSFLLLYASSQIKRSTALLLPVWGIFSLGLILPWFKLPSIMMKAYRGLSLWWADLSALLLFIPLVTDLSRQFHPWYLLWSLSFLPFVRSRLLRIVLLTFSVTSLLRYLPVLLTNNYSVEIEMVQKLITWSAVPVILVIYGLIMRRQRKP